MSHHKLRIIKLIVMSLKIAVGSSAAIVIASFLGLEHATSAGIITLLSVVSNKWDTLRLTAERFFSFFAVVVLAFATYPLLNNDWIAYGVFIFVTVLLSHMFGIQSTISTNAVIGTHFLISSDHSFRFIGNEFMLVLIGTSMAVVVNMINGNQSQKKKLLEDIFYVEDRLRKIMDDLADYLRKEEKDKNVWQDIVELEKHLNFSIEFAHDYQGNTFASHTGYYIQYMEMRSRQCNILHNLHYEIIKIRKLPDQAEVVADFIEYLRNYIYEHNEPTSQIKELEKVISFIGQEPLPATVEEFEGRAILYHILMDLEDIIILKRRFIASLTDKQRKIYWNRRKIVFKEDML